MVKVKVATDANDLVAGVATAVVIVALMYNLYVQSDVQSLCFAFTSSKNNGLDVNPTPLSLTVSE